MTQEYISDIIKKGESIRTEFKLAEKSVPSSLYETVVSFSNTDGGTILLGVDKTGSISGISRLNTSKLVSEVVTALNSRDCINPPLFVQPLLIEFGEINVIAIQIQSSSQVHDHAGKIFIREHESDIDITDNLHFTKRRKISVPSSSKKGTQSDKKGAKYRVEYIEDNQGDIKNRIKKVPGWNEKGAKLIQKKSIYIISVLVLTAEPISLSELMSVFDYKNEKSFRDKYTQPLRQSGFITMTKPSKPTDPENKYIITERGKGFLGGTLNLSEQ